MFEELTEALSIKFSHSQDGSQFDFQSSPDKEKYSIKVKCFRCYGTHHLNCQECHGTEMISYNHPMARLLEEVLVRKLNLSRGEQEREEQLEQVYPIKEQEEDSDQKKITCSYCYKECEVTTIYSQQSLRSNLCSDCTLQAPVRLHTITQNIRITDCELVGWQQKLCKNCNGEIQNCYSICLTCLDSNYNYWICGSCSDNQSYSHPSHHTLETAILFDANRSGRIEMGSEIDIEQSCEDSSCHENQLMEEVDLLVLNKTSSITVDMVPEQQAMCVQDEIEANRKTLATSCVKLEIEGLFNSYDAKSQIRSTVLKIQNKLSANQSEKKETISFASNPNSKEDKENVYCSKPSQEKVDYVFVDYRCDRCGREPIINVRYHCRECQDFDVCQACYPSCKLHHEHCFEKIDGRLMREQAIQKLLETNLLQSTSKLKRGGSCSESLNMRQTFEAVV